ncbi:putative small membrane protein [Gynuella sunshinyii YC6258]|uniref:Putative small membrane protein n=2 Tax=Gynuella sunshinyii TaxID=1445505 RepID=A0A0C5VTB8_9GAMM|nr:putative small membrane protein [Gynuella sunshinyii YC6258]
MSKQIRHGFFIVCNIQLESSHNPVNSLKPMPVMSSQRTQLFALGLLGTAVALGAFGAHIIKDLVTPERIDTWHTAARYQFWHGLALLILAEHQIRAPKTMALKTCARLFLAGTLVFSLSLYALCLTDISTLGAITPVGGVLMLSGWLYWFMTVLKQTKYDNR